MAERARLEFGTIYRGNVHGLDVFPDDPNIRITIVQGRGAVSHSPQPFLEDITRLFDLAHEASALTKDVVLLLNFALMRGEPVAQIIFAISAVEMLGQMEQWTTAQQQVLEELALTAQAAASISEEERTEVADAIRRGTHRMSLRHGVMRLLKRLDLEHLKKEWDQIYSERSTLIHGLAPRPGETYGELAFKSSGVCGQILLKYISLDVPGADLHVDAYYKA